MNFYYIEHCGARVEDDFVTKITNPRYQMVIQLINLIN